MCHDSATETSQIEKFVKEGMPQKIVKTINYLSLKKRTTAIKAISDDDVNADISSQCSDAEVNGNDNVNKMDEEADDSLAISVVWTKKVVTQFNRQLEHLKSSKIYVLLTRTTQPAHLISVAIMSFILLSIWPNINATYSTEKSSMLGGGPSNRMHHFAAIAYLGAFATHFGAQIWMTFVSGLALYFSLPRHTFGQCQQILFPKYFAFNAILSICMLILFIKFFLKNLCLSGVVQLTSLVLTVLIEVTVRLYLAPPMLRLMHEKYRIEESVGSGQETGSLVKGDLVQCPHYNRIHKTFRRIHMTIAIGNIIVLLCTCLNLLYLASRISIK